MTQRKTPYRSSGRARKVSPTLEELTPESGVQNTLEAALTLRGWTWWHVPDDGSAKRMNAGMPDIIAMRDLRMLWLECKAEGEWPTDEQADVLALVDSIGVYVQEPADVQAGVVRPSNLDFWLEQLK